MQYSTKHGQDVQGGGGQSGAAPAGPSLPEPTGAAQQAAPVDSAALLNTAVVDISEQQLAGRPLPRPGKRSRSGTTCQVSGAFGDYWLQLLGPIKVHG